MGDIVARASESRGSEDPEHSYRAEELRGHLRSAAKVLSRLARVGVEAAVRQGWDRYIGADGGFVGMSGYGASGPEDELFLHFGITAENVTAEIRKCL